MIGADAGQTDSLIPIGDFLRIESFGTEMGFDRLGRVNVTFRILLTVGCHPHLPISSWAGL